MPSLGWRDAIVEVLKSADEPMHYVDIAEAILEQGLREELGATPAKSVNAAISMSFRDEGGDSPFLRMSKAYYSLREPASSSSALAETGPAPGPAEATGFINAFGMYWSRDKVLWRTAPRLLGKQHLGSTPADFAAQRGVYLLHDARGVVYVGRTTDQPLGNRLKQHTLDRLAGRWDRFSWFGIYPVSEDGTIAGDPPEDFSHENLIATMEALLIEGLEPPQNRKRGDDFRAMEFLQVEDEELRKSRIVELMDELKEKL